MGPGPGQVTLAPPTFIMGKGYLLATVPVSEDHPYSIPAWCPARLKTKLPSTLPPTSCSAQPWKNSCKCLGEPWVEKKGCLGGPDPVYCELLLSQPLYQASLLEMGSLIILLHALQRQRAKPVCLCHGKGDGATWSAKDFCLRPSLWGASEPLPVSSCSKAEGRSW